MTTRLRQETGMVLLLVLVVVALLSSLLMEFAFSTLVDLRLAETFRDTTRAYYLAKGGVQVGRMLLQQDNNGWDSRDEMWAQGVTNYPVGDGFVTVQIDDLGGRLNLNGLVDETDNPNAVAIDRFVRLFTELGLEHPGDLTAALVDWIDVNDEDYQGVGNGAENAYYRGLKHPYSTKNAPFDSLDELSMVRGFTPEVCNLVRPFLTVHSGGLINVNTAPPEVIMALAPEMDLTSAETIIEARQSQPFETVAALQELPGLGPVYGFIHLYISVTSPTFRITASGGVGDGARRVVAVIRKADDKLLYFKVE